jgi:TIR domain-containing protein
MALIFVNYRRGPHSIAVSALAERLVQHFGPELVFHDARLISGTRYPDELRKQLEACAVLIAVIHPNWVHDLAGRRDERLDWVEFEISTVLAAGKPVIPVLLDEAEPPTDDQLPPSIAELALRQVARLRAPHYSSDVNELIRRLDREVSRNAQRTVNKQGLIRRRPKPLAFWAKVAGWSALLSIISLGQVLESDEPVWRAFFIEAFLLILAMTLATLLLSVVALLSRRLYRLERRTSVLPFRRYAANAWGVAAFMVTVSALGWFKIVDLASHYMTLSVEVRILLVTVGLIALVYWLQRIILDRDTRDKEWPPTVTSNPVEFRRVAQRLQERLTWPEWQPPRSREQQEQAVSVYLSLAEARLEMKTQATYSWQRWLAGGFSTNPMLDICLAFTLTATGFLLTAGAIRLYHGDTPVRMLATIVVSLLILAALTAAAIGIEFRSYRKNRTWLVDELTQLQSQLGPLIFMQDAANHSSLPATYRDDDRPSGVESH